MAFYIVSEGPRRWQASVDAEGHREYKMVILVQTDDSRDGPALALQTPGLPIPGMYWLVGNDVDVWAWCRANIDCSPLVENEPNFQFNLTFTFSTKPNPMDRGGQRCQDARIEDPLLEPPKFSGSFVKKTEQGVHDRFGNLIKSSSHEPYLGPENEWDADGGDIINVEFNSPILALYLLAALKNCVSDAPMWGVAARCVKFNNYSWERHFHGLCYVYYRYKLEFEVQGRGFDRVFEDVGTKVLNGFWGDADLTGTSAAAAGGTWELLNIAGAAPDPMNPQHFIRAKDRNGENMHVDLDGAGKPADLSLPVLSCAQTPSGSPNVWYVLGFTTADTGLPQSTTRKGIAITHTTGCTWSGPAGFGGGTVELTYDVGDSEWYLTVSPTLPTTWWLPPGAHWVPEGPNKLVQLTDDPSGQGGPKEIVLYRTGAPGKFLIEKYQSANLLLLGVPATF